MENTKIKPASRRKQREVAVQLLFEMKMQKEENMDFVLNYYEMRELDIRNYTYTMQIAKNYIEHMEEIEQILTENVQNWRIERVGKTEISIIRVATVEMLYHDDVPAPVAINEAVEVAKKFSDERAYRFVNKVLRNVLEATKEA